MHRLKTIDAVEKLLIRGIYRKSHKQVTELVERELGRRLFLKARLGIARGQVTGDPTLSGKLTKHAPDCSLHVASWTSVLVANASYRIRQALHDPAQSQAFGLAQT